MKIIKVKNYDELSKKAANIIASQIISNNSCTLGLATGSTPIGTYKELVKLYNENIIDFSNVKTANLDEYKGLTKDNDQSYYYFMHQNLFNHVNINKNNTYIPDGTIENPDTACKSYEEILKKLGGVDLQLLGLGHNGHIGFNEPRDTFSLETNCVELAESTIKANARFFESIDDVPTKAYTMGIGTIMKAKKILIIVNGIDKADIVQKLVEGVVTPNVPASVLKFHQDVTLIADEEALSKCTLN